MSLGGVPAGWPVNVSCACQAFEKGFKRAIFDRMDTGELDMGAPLHWTCVQPSIVSYK